MDPSRNLEGEGIADMNKSEPKYIQETLAWCNRLRVKDGKEPLANLPLGVPGDAESCPCGLASGWEVYEGGATRAVRNPETRKIKYLNANTNRSVRLFIKKFDEHKIPQYIDPSYTSPAAFN